MDFEGLANQYLGSNDTIYGSTPIQDVEDLKKALQTSYATDVASYTGGDALRLQSLEKALHIITFRAQHLVLWREIEKDIAYSTVEEYTLLKGYGSDGGISFVGQTETPIESVGDYERKVAFVKFMGVVRSVSLASVLVRKLVPDIIGRETTNGIMKILADWTWAMYWGDSKKVRNSTQEGLEFDGIISVVEREVPQNVYDLRGGIDLDRALSYLAEVIYNQYGTINRLFAPSGVIQKFTQSYYGQQRVFIPTATGGIGAGFFISQFDTIAGTVLFRPDALFRPQYTYSTTATSNQAPNPQITVNAAFANNTTADWSKGNVAGNSVQYAVVAGNTRGLSAPVQTASVSITANETRAIRITITEVNQGTIPAQFYVIFRNDIESNGRRSGFGVVAVIPASSLQQNNTITFDDTNRILPNSKTAVVGNFTRECLVFSRLLPLVRVPLPVVGQAIPWMILLYGVPKYYNPRWLGVIRNIDYVRTI